MRALTFVPNVIKIYYLTPKWKVYFLATMHTDFITVELGLRPGNKTFFNLLKACVCLFIWLKP